MTLSVQSEQGFPSDDETGLMIGDEMIDCAWIRQSSTILAKAL